RELGAMAASGTRADLTDALNAHLLAERRAGRLSVVVVDEAQAVSIEVLEQLRLLSNLETSTEKLLRLVLVGQPQLAALLVDPALAQLNQRITLRWHLGPLTAEETAAYVRHRLSVASGGKVTELFTRTALSLVHRLSRGVPRLVNMIAHRSLLVAYVARRHRVGARDVLHAYREIRTVPLRRWSPARPVGWAAAMATVLLAVMTLGVPRGARVAVDAVLAAWRVPGLDSDETDVPAQLEPVAWRRGLEVLPLTGNLSMLRLLDLPAVLELHVPGAAEPRYAALVGNDD